MTSCRVGASADGGAGATGASATIFGGGVADSGAAGAVSTRSGAGATAGAGLTNAPVGLIAGAALADLVRATARGRVARGAGAVSGASEAGGGSSTMRGPAGGGVSDASAADETGSTAVGMASAAAVIAATAEAERDVAEWGSAGRVGAGRGVAEWGSAGRVGSELAEAELVGVELAGAALAGSGLYDGTGGPLTTTRDAAVDPDRNSCMLVLSAAQPYSGVVVSRSASNRRRRVNRVAPVVDRTVGRVLVLA